MSRETVTSPGGEQAERAGGEYTLVLGTQVTAIRSPKQVVPQLKEEERAHLAENNDAKGKLEKGQDKLGEEKTKQDFLQKALSETIGYIQVE